MNPTPVIGSALADGLVRLMVRVELPPVAIVAGENALVTVGAAWSVVVSVAVAAAAVPALPVTTDPVELMKLPAVALVTGIFRTQTPPTGMLPPESARELDPEVPVTVPLQPGLLLASKTAVDEKLTRAPPPG